MAEILVKAIDATHSNPVKDQRGCFKRGMPAVVMPDGHPWGNDERLPKFVVIKIPLVSVSQALKYIAEWSGVRIRRWRIRWVDLPLAARTKLQTDGELVIKAKAEYTGAFDYTWLQVKQFFRNDETGLDETDDLT